MKNLKSFRKMILDNMDVIEIALKADLNQLDANIHLVDCLREVEFMMSNLGSLMRSKSVTSEISFINFPARGEIVPEPLGTVLIVGTWNYPFHSALGPLPGAIAAGNTVFIKPGSLCHASSRLIRELVRGYFNPKEIACMEGGIEIMQPLLNDMRFDHIFFTGGSGIGKIVMEAAGRNLTPVTLELGGKNPCIITKSADLVLAARRIAWAKWASNAGQVCIAPDHVLVHADIADAFLIELGKTVHEFFPNGTHEDPAYCRIISHGHTKRLKGIIEKDEKFVVKNFLSTKDPADEKYVPPTVIDFGSDMNAFRNSAAMAGEIFGPILPIVRFDSTSECVEYLSSHSRANGAPLALYVFSRDGTGLVKNQFMPACPSGGVVVNDCSMHIAEGCLPFGGVGISGVGKYHDGKTFEIFSHFRPVLWKNGWLDIPSRYPPYSTWGMRMVSMMLWMSRKNITPVRVLKLALLVGLVYKIIRR